MDWSAFRTQFPTASRWAFMDHAAVAPISLPAANAMRAWIDDLVVNGIVGWNEREKHVEEVRARAATLLNADAGSIAFVANTTSGVSIVAEGYPWKPGDNLVLAAEEYPANQYPWLNLHDRGVEARRVASRGSRISVDDVFAAMDARTRVVSLSAVEFSSGYRNDLAAIGECCRRKGVFFFVDAIQQLGAIPLDVSALPIDALAADGHKWLLGPEGLGIFYVRRDWLDLLHPIGVGGNSVIGCHDYSTIDFRLKPNAGRWEGGTWNMAGISGLGASLNLLLDAGIPVLCERVMALTDHLCARAPEAGLEVFSSRLEKEKSSIVSLATPGRSPQELKKRCHAAGVIVNVRAGRLRVSPHAYNTIDDIDRFIEAVK